MTAGQAYPGLEAILRRAFDRAREGLPPDVGIGVMFAFHYGPAGEGGLAWVAGTRREDAIGFVVEWLRQQVNDGHQEAVRTSMRKWFGPNQESGG